jgi:fluoride ion exporter CrcB/FEX
MLTDPLYTLQIVLTSILGGIVRYLAEFLAKSQELDKLSLGLMIVHAIVGVFAGYMSFLVISYFTTTEVAGIIAAGLGSFGGYGTLTWLIHQMKKKLVLMDKTEFDEFVKKHKK